MSNTQRFLLQAVLLISAYANGTCQTTSMGQNECIFTFHVPKQTSSGLCSSGAREGSNGAFELLQRQVANLAEDRVNLQKQVTEQQKQINSMQQQLTNSGGNTGPNTQNMGSTLGTVYKRWGKRTCPTNTTMMYSGYMAGVYWSSQGGTSSRLCLPKNPQFGDSGFPSDLTFHPSFIYGTEYELHAGGNPSDLHDQDAPCALCLATGKSTHVVLPAHTECPHGWTMEYRGYMMSSHNNPIRPHTAAVCVDESPDVLDGGRASVEGALLYVMVTKCGIIPCPPYEERELACVVCTM